MALGKTVAELMEMSNAEMLAWQNFYASEPFGEQRADLRAGIVAATIANSNKGKGGKTWAPVEFMPYVERPNLSDAEIEKRINFFMQRYQ